MSQIDDAITEGAYFQDDNSRDIVIGAKLAEILEVELGDRVVVTVTQAQGGDPLTRDVPDFRHLSICRRRDEQRHGIRPDWKSTGDACYRERGS